MPAGNHLNRNGTFRQLIQSRVPKLCGREYRGWRTGAVLLLAIPAVGNINLGCAPPSVEGRMPPAAPESMDSVAREFVEGLAQGELPPNTMASQAELEWLIAHRHLLANTRVTHNGSGSYAVQDHRGDIFGFALRDGTEGWIIFHVDVTDHEILLKMTAPEESNRHQ